MIEKYAFNQPSGPENTEKIIKNAKPKPQKLKN